MNICIYGASSADLEQIYYDKTEELGRMMAKRGHGLVFGGGATGMMEASILKMGISSALLRVSLTSREFYMRIAVNLFLQKLCASEKNSLRNVPMQQS